MQYIPAYACKQELCHVGVWTKKVWLNKQAMAVFFKITSQD